MKNICFALLVLMSFYLKGSEAHHHPHHKHVSTIHIDIEAGRANKNALDTSTESSSSDFFKSTKVRLALISGATSVIGAAIGAGVTLAIQYSKCKN
jgi:hypothetical protein